MPKKKPRFYTNLQAACDSEVPGHLLVIAISHQMPDPIADMTSYVIDLELDAKPPKYEIVIKADEQLFPKYHSGFNCMVRDPSGTLFVGEDDGIIRYREGKAALIDFGAHAGITNCCYVRGVDDVVFGTLKGEAVHFTKQGLRAVPLASPTKIKANECHVNAIHGIGPDFMVAVGESGLVSRYRKSTWERIKPPSNTYMTSIWCRSETEIYIGAKRGLVWCWDGDSRWKKLKVDFEHASLNFTFACITEYQGTMYAACVDHGVYRLVGDTWVAIPKVKDEDVCFLVVTSLGLLGLGALWGDSGSWLTRFDGTTWTTQQIHVDPV